MPTSASTVVVSHRSTKGGDVASTGLALRALDASGHDTILEGIAVFVAVAQRAVAEAQATGLPPVLEASAEELHAMLRACEAYLGCG